VIWDYSPKSNGFFHGGPMCHLSTEFCENPLSSFCLSLQTNKQMNDDDNITSLAEIKMALT